MLKIDGQSRFCKEANISYLKDPLPEKKEIKVVEGEDDDIVFLGSSRSQNAESVDDDECAIPFHHGALPSLLEFDGIDIENMSFDDDKTMNNNQHNIRLKSLFNASDDVTVDKLSSADTNLVESIDFDCMVPVFHTD